MAKKKAFALRIDENLMAAIEKWSIEEFRSTNGQIEFMLHTALRDANRLPKQAEQVIKKSQSKNKNT